MSEPTLHSLEIEMLFAARSAARRSQRQQRSARRKGGGAGLMKLLRWLLVACPVLIILSFLSLVLLRSSSDVSETPVVDKLRSVEHFPMDCSSGEDLSSRTSRWNSELWIDAVQRNCDLISRAVSGENTESSSGQILFYGGSLVESLLDLEQGIPSIRVSSNAAQRNNREIFQEWWDDFVQTHPELGQLRDAPAAMAVGIAGDQSSDVHRRIVEEDELIGLMQQDYRDHLQRLHPGMDVSGQDSIASLHSRLSAQLEEVQKELSELRRRGRTEMERRVSLRGNIVLLIGDEDILSSVSETSGHGEEAEEDLDTAAAKIVYRIVRTGTALHTRFPHRRLLIISPPPPPPLHVQQFRHSLRLWAAVRAQLHRVFSGDRDGKDSSPPTARIMPDTICRLGTSESSRLSVRLLNCDHVFLDPHHPFLLPQKGQRRQTTWLPEGEGEITNGGILPGRIDMTPNRNPVLTEAGTKGFLDCISAYLRRFEQSEIDDSDMGVWVME